MIPPSHLAGRAVVVGISGGIAAYKSAELVRLLVKAGAEVQVVMTAAAQQFITPLTLQALSTRRVATSLFDCDEEAEIGHIRIADRAALVVIAPATADLIARLAAGLGDDLLATVALATRAPLLLAPAMNVNMWQHPATQENLARLAGRGVHFVGPDQGALACGWVGAGRLIEPPLIVEACARLLAAAAAAPRDLDGVRLLVTAGPTHEAIDPVRYLANRSSGKMGFALAARAAARGAAVTLVAGPTALPTPITAGGAAVAIQRLDVVTAQEMHDAVMSRVDEVDVIVKAAAVADFRPLAVAAHKIKKGSAEELTLQLVRNPDILATLGERRRQGHPRPLLIGFAAETEEVTSQARAKLLRKGCDLLVANDVSARGEVFGADESQVLLLAPEVTDEPVARTTKAGVADRILDRVVGLLAAP